MDLVRLANRDVRHRPRRTTAPERPHPNDRTRARNCGSPMPNGNRLTALATNTKGGQLPDLGLRHRRRARCADRIRNAKDTDLKNPPLHDFSHAPETAA
jgi:hypothetical protein